MNLPNFALLCLPFLMFTACETTRAPVSKPQSLVTLKTVKIGEHSIDLYVDYGDDSAVLGFTTSNDLVNSDNAAGMEDLAATQYFPLYASTYRGLPPVVLDIFVSSKQDEMWIRSSWKGHDTLAYHRLGSKNATTPYGNVAAINTPTPASLGGSPIAFPEMDEEEVSKVATVRP